MAKDFNMTAYRVSFIGHREVEDYFEIEKKLMEEIKNLIFTKEFVEFQIGRSGEFDILSASCIKKSQKIYGNHNSEITLVLPYKVADMEYYEKYYDNIIIPQEVERVHFKSAITKRNQWLVNNSELLIAYVRKDKGGASDCLKMAENKNLSIIKI